MLFIDFKSSIFGIYKSYLVLSNAKSKKSPKFRSLNETKFPRTISIIQAQFVLVVSKSLNV